MNSKSNIVTVILVSMIFSLVFSATGIFTLIKYFPQHLPQMETETSVTSEKIIEVNSSEEDLVVNLAENKKEAVVSIVITKEIQQIQQLNPFDFFFRSPFGNTPFEEFEVEEEPVRREIGGGTGFFISKDGLIATNKHVVRDTQADYSIVTSDGDTFEVEVVARDPFFDFALVRVKNPQKDFPILEFADSDSIKVGQTVIAIGNALAQFDGSVTKGIISGLNRNTTASDGMGRTDTLSNVIQVDVAINPGNSGGPLLGLDGKVVGINTAVASAENVGFVLPVNDIKQAVNSYQEFGEIIRPRLGVRYVLVNKELQEANGLPYDYGALLIRGERPVDLAIIPGSPADKAGLEENDIILEIDKTQITQENSLLTLIQKKSIGDTLELKVWHDGEEKIVETTLENFES